ncbi:MAG: hypothetical protein U0271_41360 [Polyangiaceae bacterium]
MTPRPSLLDRYRQAGLLTRIVLHVSGMLLAFSLVVGGISVVAVAGTRALFPPSQAEALASGSGAGEADDPAGPAPLSTSKNRTARTNPSSRTAPKRAANTPAAAGSAPTRAKLLPDDSTATNE